MCGKPGPKKTTLFCILTDDKNIGTFRNFDKLDRNVIAQVVCEIEIAKTILLARYDELDHDKIIIEEEDHDLE